MRTTLRILFAAVILAVAVVTPSRADQHSTTPSAAPESTTEATPAPNRAPVPQTTVRQPPPCAPRAEFLEHLSINYAEAPVAMGITANAGLLEVLAGSNGSWTIIVTMPSGLSCGVASGMNWENNLSKKSISDSGA